MDNTYEDLLEEFEDECNFCGEPCNGDYCSNWCKRGYEAEN